MGKSAANKKNPETAKDVSGGGGKSGKTYRRSASTAVDEDMEIFISLAIEHKEEGNKLFQKRDLEGAMLRYGKSVNLLPKNHIDVAYLRTSIACCYMQMGLDLYPNAISECDLALEASPRYSKALLTRSQCYEALDKLDYAFWDARTVLNMEPKNASGNVIFERVKKRLVDKGVDVDKMEKNFVNVKENRVKKNRGKDDGVKSNRAVVESPKVEMVDEAKSKYKPNEEKSLEPEIDGKMGGDREVKEEGFKNDQGQNKESGNMAGEERKLEDTVAVMDNELITSEIVEGGQSTKEEATVEVELVHGDEVKEEGFKNDQGQNKESGNMAGEERKLEDTVVVMDNELITSEIVEGGQSTKEEATVAVELVHGDEVRRTELHDGTEVEACCPICYEDVPQPETFTVFGCFHRFCYTCMRLYLTSTLELRKPLICPTYGCKTEIETVDCNVFASPAQIAMMIQRKAEESIEVSDRVYCPNPQCSFLMSARGLAVLDAALPGARKCLQCGLRFCINCNMEWHRKMTCGQFQKTMAYKKSGTAVFDAAARKLGWQKCRKCHCTVELAHGCKRMTCLFCKYEFCYSCGKEWTKKHEC